MAKGIRSKIKKRFRTVKRQRVEKMIDLPRREASNAALAKLMRGEARPVKQVKNAFLFPMDPDAEIPQKCVKKPIDFRAETLPMSGFALKGNRRKYTEDEKADLKALSRDHPDQKILAGKGVLPASSCKIGGEQLGASVLGAIVGVSGTTTKPAKESNDDKMETNSDEEEEIMRQKSEQAATLRQTTGDGVVDMDNMESKKNRKAVDTSRRPVVKKSTGSAATGSKNASGKKKTQRINKFRGASKKK
ncbi:unnamed protein product [Amoebophrya sp. A25]|nr:unnamed protein product [Amoebophrya sp. A25]|eukprot:GSA25T00019497001.1